MKKLIIAVVVVALLGVGGYFGFTRYVQSRARGDVESVFAALRQQGAQAGYGTVAFDLSGRVLTVTGIDIALPDGAGSVKLDKLVASGITSPSGGTIQAARIDLEGLAVAANGVVAPGAAIAYAVPKARIDNYTGPDRLLPVTAGNGSHPAVRQALVHFAAVRADSLEVPNLTGRATPAPGTPGASGPAQPVDITYSGLKASGIADGRIAEVTLDRIGFVTKLTVGTASESTTGEINALRASGIDTGPVRALTDAEPRATTYQPVYAKISTGLYKLAQEHGPTVSVGAIAVERVAINPVDLSFQRLDALTALSQREASLGPDETARLLTLTADTLGGIAVGQVAFTDMTVTDTSGTAKVAALRFEGFSGGKLDSLTLEGLAGTTADQRPVSLKRVALRGLSLDALLRLSADGAKNDNQPTMDTAFGLFRVLSGVELEGISAPHETGGQMVTIEAMSLNWGDLAGALPTWVKFKLTKASGPISTEDGEPFSYLAAAGIDKATMSLQLDLAYDPAAHTLTLSPAATEVEKAFSVQVEGRLDNVPRSAFEDPAGAFLALGEATAGPVTVVVKNLGIADLVLKQQAEAAGVEPEDLRAELASGIQQAAKDAATVTADAQSVGAALAAFVKSPGTLTVTVTPKQPVPVMQLLSLDSPLDAMRLFSVTATAAP